MEDKKDILFTEMGHNIGQFRIEDADAEVERMNRQTHSNLWHKDFHHYLDEYDNWERESPVKLQDGYCWVTCD